jgi:hypothetical protein
VVVFVCFRAAANERVNHLGRRQVKERVLQPSFGQAAQYVGPPPGCVAEAVRTVLVAVHDASTMSGTGYSLGPCADLWPALGLRRVQQGGQRSRPMHEVSPGN